MNPEAQAAAELTLPVSYVRTCSLEESYLTNELCSTDPPVA